MKTEKTLMVIPFDMAAISNDINASLPKIKDTTYFITGVEGVVKGTDIIVDNECCYSLPGDSKCYGWGIYEKTKVDDGYSLSFMPVSYKEFPISELIEKFSLPETSLEEFMGDRFNYNSRIKNNTQSFIKEINKILK